MGIFAFLSCFEFSVPNHIWLHVLLLDDEMQRQQKILKKKYYQMWFATLFEYALYQLDIQEAFLFLYLVVF